MITSAHAKKRLLTYIYVDGGERVKGFVHATKPFLGFVSQDVFSETDYANITIFSVGCEMAVHQFK